MKTEDLQKQGLTQEQIDFVMAENGRDLKKLQKEVESLTAERDNLEKRAENAEETLKNFEGIDPEKIQSELEDWKKKAEEAEKEADRKLYERDYADALKTELESVKFTSEAAKRDVMAQITAAELKLRDGKILGLNDLLNQIREVDVSAFVDEKQQQLEQNKAKFTQPRKDGYKPGTKVSPAELMKMKNENPNLDISQYM